jgi:hypothetical protein
MYEITFRPAIDLIDIKWSGAFSPDIVATYAREVYAGFTSHKFSPGYLLRIDMSESAVQPQDAVVAFGEMFDGFPKASRIAIVTPSRLAHMQVQRVMTQPYLRVFDRAEPALAWLTDRQTCLA